MTKQSAEFIEAELEFDPSEIGADHFSNFEVRVYKGNPKDKNNICMKVVIAKKGVFDVPVKKRKKSGDNFNQH